MTQLTARQVWGYYEMVNMPANRAVAWVSVAYGESGFNTEATSYVDARGLYQFMRYSWPGNLGSFDQNAYDPYWNTLAMRELSGDGMNFAPWDSCYANINRSGRYSFLSWPQVGSSVYNSMWLVAGLMGAKPPHGLSPPSQPGVTGTLPAALQRYGELTHTIIPQATKRQKLLAATIARMYRLGGG
jgi:hypothetical protein